MVGGKVIEITGNRIWVVGIGPDEPHELAVFYENDLNCKLPVLGEEIWWQSGRIYFAKDRLSLRKVGYSHDPRNTEDQPNDQ